MDNSAGVKSCAAIAPWNGASAAAVPCALIICSVVALLWTGCLQTGLTAMHTAAQFGQQEFVRLMLAKVPATITTEPPQADANNPLLCDWEGNRRSGVARSRLKPTPTTLCCPSTPRSAELQQLFCACCTSSALCSTISQLDMRAHGDEQTINTKLITLTDTFQRKASVPVNKITVHVIRTKKSVVQCSSDEIQVSTKITLCYSL